MKKFAIFVLGLILIAWMLLRQVDDYNRIMVEDFDGERISVYSQVGIDHFDIIMGIARRGKSTEYYSIYFYPARDSSAAVRIFYCKELQVIWVALVLNGEVNEIIASYSLFNQKVVSAQSGKLIGRSSVKEASSDREANNEVVIPLDEVCAELISEASVNH